MKSTTKKVVPSSKKETAKSEGIPTDVHERLLALLETKNVRQVDFAHAMKKSKDWASRTMSGERGLSVETLVKLTEVFGVDLHWLLTGQGEIFFDTTTKNDSATDYIDEAITRLKQVRKLIAKK